jgi:hypothetical protein
MLLNVNDYNEALLDVCWILQYQIEDYECVCVDSNNE